MIQNKKRYRKILVLLVCIIIIGVSHPLNVSADEEKPVPYYFLEPTIFKYNNLIISDTGINLFTGSLGYSYSLELPHGTNNLQPNLNLIYNSQSTTSSAPGIIGAGWELSQNYIGRYVNYSFSDTSDDKFKLVLNGQVYNLIYVSGEGRWHTEIESYLNIRNLSGGNNTNGQYWIVKTTDGKTYRFGYQNYSELASNLYNYTTKWSLDLVNDTYNNNIYYNYSENPYPNDLGTVYLNKIEYNNDKRRSVEFIYESSDRPDLWTIYQQGNKIRESKRLKEIKVMVDNNLVRKYLAEYTKFNISSISVLSRITEYGSDNETLLPQTEFNYIEPKVGWNNESDKWSWDPAYGFHDESSMLVDINGDGLADILQTYPLGSRYVWINNGTGFKNASDVWKIPVDFGNSVRMGDINGDGLPDFIYAHYLGPNNYNYEFWINNASKSYLLANITNQFGGQTLINYKKSTELDNNGNDSISDLGFNVWVVSNITEYNGMNNSQNLTIVKTYNYSGGKYEYYPKNEFRGFNYVDEKIGDKKTEQWFYQDDGKKGNEYKTEILDLNDNSYKKQEFSFNSTFNNSYYITLLGEESEYIYDNISTNPKIINISYDYDGFGNVIKKWSKGDVNDSSDDKYEYYNYLNNTNLWIINKIKNYSLLNNNSVKIKESLYSYDNLAYGNAPTKGSLTKKEDWLNTGTNPVTFYGYDSYGNIINQTDANNHTTKYTYGLRDPTYTFADQIINVKNHTTNYYYDLGTGNLLSETDSNGNIKNYTYDVFGRKINKILPYDNITYPTTKYEYDFDGIAPEKIKIMKREQSGISNTLDEYSFYDGFGRLIQNKQESENQKQIVSNTFYDNTGRIKSKSNQYFDNFYENYTSPNMSINNVSYDYDILDRVIKITNPDNTYKNISYNHWNITFYDENGHRKDYSLDAYDKIKSVKEYNGVDIYTTLYNYNPLGNIIGLIDAKGNIFNYTYDSLGRKIRMKDPDLGIWNYSYDNIGNILVQTDNRNISVSMQYDELNRIIKKSSPEENITYIYDINKNNTISQIQTISSTINYTYDNRTRKISEIKIFNGIKFIINYSYDSMDRVILKILPDKTNVTYVYNNQGRMYYINNLLNISYNEYNKPTTKIYKNNLTTNFTYNKENLRLTNINTGNKQNLSYSYDYVGNIKQINDTIKSRYFSMNYDDLDRLIYTNIINYSNGQNKSLNFSYNEIGNMLNSYSNTDNMTFYYNSSLAHTPYKIITTGINISQLSINLIYPLQNINVTQNQFFNFTTQVCCYNSDCGDVNVTLDPEEETTAYSSSSETHCIGNRCTKTFYSGTRFVYEDNQWKKVEDARSLMNVWNILKKEDPNFPAQVVDFNYTSIILDISASGNKLNKDMPLKVYNKFNISEKPKDILGNIKDKDKIFNINSINTKQRVVIDLSDTVDSILGQEIKWGDHSTTIQLEDNITENLGDSYVYNYGSNSNYGNDSILTIRSHTTPNFISYIMFNTSMLSGITLENAILVLTVYNSYHSGVNVSVRQNDNRSWTEGTITWSNRPQQLGVYPWANGTILKSININSQTTGTTFIWNVTSSWTETQINNYKNITFILTPDTSGDWNDIINFASKECGTVAYRPYLNITYSINNQKGIIPNQAGSTPFYTNITNPYNLSLNQNECRNITWFVNATGTGNYTFFAYVNKTSDQSISNITNKINISIINSAILPNDTSKYYIKDSSGNPVAWLGNSGNIVLKGKCFNSTNCNNPGDNSFIIRNSTNNNVAYINSTGDLCIGKGDCSDQSSTCNPARDAFIIRNSTNSNMSYIDFDGDLCLTGRLYQNSNP